MKLMRIGNTPLASILRLVASIIICQLAGLIGSVFTRSSIPTWYAGLKKPSFTPPNWLFAPVWTTLYLLIGIAAFLVWRRNLENREVKISLILFAVQLIFNTLWSIVFFGLRSPLLGVIVISILWVAILLTTINFLKVSKLIKILTHSNILHFYCNHI